VLAFLLISAPRLFSQSFTYYNYSIPDGLPSSEVYEVFQDSKGFLWFATDNGVVKYDGLDFQTFHTKDGLSDPVVFGFHEDAGGKIWFRSYSGKLSFYKDGKITAYKYNNVIASNFKPGSFIHSIHSEANGDLWTSGHAIIGKITADGKLEQNELKDPGLTITQIGKSFLITTHSTTFRDLTINGKKFPISPVESQLLNSSSHVTEWRGKLYISVNRDVFAYDGKVLERIAVRPRMIISLSTDRDDNLWIGYMNSGVEKYSKADLTEPFEFPFLKQKSVTKILQDPEGGFWVTTLESGIYYLPTLAVENFPLGIPAKIRAFKQVGAEDVVIGDQSGRLYLMNLPTKQKKTIKAFSAPILTVYQDKRGNFWIGTATNDYLYDKDFKELKSFKNNSTTSFSENDHFVFGQGGNRLLKFSFEGEMVEAKTTDLSARSIQVDNQKIYLAGRIGLYALDFNFNRQGGLSNLENTKITDIEPFNDSTILLITQGNGFMLLNTFNDRVFQYDTKTGFIGNNIYSSLEDGSVLYFGTEKGLVEIDRSTLNSRKNYFRALSDKSGLSGKRIDFLAKTKDFLYAVTENGVSIIPKQEFSTTGTKPTFYAKSIMINQRPTDSIDFNNLDHTQNNIRVSFGFISFKNNKNIVARFRLSQAEDWTYTTSRSIDFYSMAPGTYALDLQYSTDNNFWMDGIKGMQFSIQTPWWELWYYQIIPVLAFLLFVYIYFRNRVQLIKQREQNLEIITQNQQKLIQAEIVVAEKERSRIAKDLHDSVGTNMVATKMLIGQLLRKHHEPMAEQVEEQLQTIVQEIKEIIYNLAPPGVERYGLFTILKDLVKRLGKSTSIEITVNTYGNDIKNSGLTTVILRIVQELLVNSFKHSSARNINLDVSVFEDRLNLIYEDDGVGFSLASATRGSGLDNIETRLKTINGQIKFESGDFGISYNIDIPLTSKK